MSDADLSLAVTQLMKGVVYQDTHERAWTQLMQLQPQVRDYVAVLGLQVVVDEAEGYAFLRQRPTDEDDTLQTPRLIPRRLLSFTSACCSRCSARSSRNSTPTAERRG